MFDPAAVAGRGAVSAEVKAVLDEALAGAEAACEDDELLLAIAGGWHEIDAAGLAATFSLGGVSDEYYGDFGDDGD